MKKNQVIIYTGLGVDKKRVELYNFETIDHIVINSVSFIRVCCDGRFYYYQTSISYISSINIYNRG